MELNKFQHIALFIWSTRNMNALDFLVDFAASMPTARARDEGDGNFQAVRGSIVARSESITGTNTSSNKANLETETMRMSKISSAATEPCLGTTTTQRSDPNIYTSHDQIARTPRGSDQRSRYRAVNEIPYAEAYQQTHRTHTDPWTAYHTLEYIVPTTCDSRGTSQPYLSPRQEQCLSDTPESHLHGCHFLDVQPREGRTLCHDTSVNSTYYYAGHDSMAEDSRRGDEYVRADAIAMNYWPHISVWELRSEEGQYPLGR